MARGRGGFFFPIDHGRVQVMMLCVCVCVCGWVPAGGLFAIM